MSFIETPAFPDRIAANMEGGPTWATRVVVLQSGHEQRNIEWSAARMRYNLGTAIKSAAELVEVLAWMRCLRGRAHGFRIRDPIDHSATVANGYVGTVGVGDGTPTGQLHKYYSVGALNEARQINKPRTGTVSFLYDGSPITPSALDTTTGVVTWSAFASQSVVTVTPGATTDVELAANLSGLLVGDKLYLSGLTGTIGAALNGLAHTVLTISGGSSEIYELDIDTTGLAYTSGGTGAFYPQASKSLRWAGQFDVPVRFMNDAMALMIQTTRFQQWNDIPLVEIRV